MNWNQLRTIVWLRWCLTRNQWRRHGSVSGALAAFAVVGAALMVVTLFTGGLLAGAYPLAREPALTLLIVFDALTALFLFFWVIGLLTDVQRSETIDLRRLMHLPVSLRECFSINYVISHLTFSVLFFAPAITGLSIGLAWKRPGMALLAPLGWSLIFMLSAWTYCLRGWLAALMVNQRHRRTIVVVMTLLIVIIGQIPNFYFNVLRSHERNDQIGARVLKPRSETEADAETMAKVARVHPYVPVLWLANGARYLAEGRTWPAVAGMCASLVIGAAGLHRAYRGTVRFYQGESSGRKRRERAPGEPLAALPKRSLLALRIRALPDQAVAVGLGCFRSLMRAPEVKMTLTIPAIMALAFGGMLLTRSTATVPAMAKPFIATCTGYSAMFFTFQLFSNHFGFDRHGFRSLVLSPIDRKLILLGKNLATFPIGIVLGLVLLTAVSVWLHLRPLVYIATMFHLLTQITLASIVGNWMSILLPYRIEPGSMKATKMPVKTTFLIFLTSLLTPILMVPTFAPPTAELLWSMAGWPAWIPINLLLSLLLAALAIYIYWRTLDPMGRLLIARERQILHVVTAEVE